MYYSKIFDLVALGVGRNPYKYSLLPSFGIFPIFLDWVVGVANAVFPGSHKPSVVYF